MLQIYIVSEIFRDRRRLLVGDEIVEVLLEVYKKLRQEEDADAMNEMLDLFDEYVYRDNRVMKAAVALLT
jgi:hypothetical protein